MIEFALEKIKSLENRYYHLMVLAGTDERKREVFTDSLAKEIDAPIININLEVSRQLLELPVKQRPLHVPGILDAIIKPYTQRPFIFKNIELLFNNELKTDPMRLFKSISRNNTLIVSWNGRVNGEFLAYSEAGRPDYKKYPVTDLIFINLHDES